MCPSSSGTWIIFNQSCLLITNLQLYLKKLKSVEIFENDKVFEDNLVDIFETIFLEIFIKNKNYKISKIFYLSKLLIRLIIKK